MVFGKENKEEIDFSKSGPKHLCQIDWGDEDHRRVVAACLVKGAYVKRSDLSRHRGDDGALAPPWWRSVGFNLVRDLADISPAFGAIYEFDHSASAARGDRNSDKAPEFVVAFRGTQSVLDMGLDLVLSCERLQHNNRVQKACDEVRSVVPKNSEDGRCNIWIAGHSLGASVACFVGMKMAEDDGVFLDAFLFNPPYLRLDPETLKHREVRILVEGVQKLLASLLKGFMVEGAESNSYRRMHRWVPQLFVNPDDYICKGFIKYFDHRESFVGMKAGNILRVRDGDRCMDLNRILGHVDDYSVYLLPSGKLITNMTEEPEIHGLGKHTRKILRGHKLSQWWRDDLHLKREEYIHNDN